MDEKQELFIAAICKKALQLFSGRAARGFVIG
jgi:hypothetical protein